MPSAWQFSFLREAVGNHPIVVATSAATGGVLLGAFMAFELLAAPPKLKAERATPPQLAAMKPVAETTGSASSGESIARTDCDQQTWPYLSRVCMEEMRRKNPAPRVVSTDKLDRPTVTAIESPPAAPSVPPQPAAPTPALVSPAVAATAPPAAIAVAVPPATAEVAKPDEETNGNQIAAKPEFKPKRSAKKLKRKTQPPVKPELKDDEDSPTVASRDGNDEASDDRGADRRADRRNSRSRRVVDRWTERDYDVDSEDGGSRRVTVIRRNRNGGMFENLFGMGRDRDDD